MAKTCGAEYPELNASVRYFDIGCPYACKVNKRDGRIQETEPIDELMSRANEATHIVFNIGAHYEGFDADDEHRPWQRYPSSAQIHR